MEAENGTFSIARMVVPAWAVEGVLPQLPAGLTGGDLLAWRRVVICSQGDNIVFVFTFHSKYYEYFFGRTSLATGSAVTGLLVSRWFRSTFESQ